MAKRMAKRRKGLEEEPLNKEIGTDKVYLVPKYREERLLKEIEGKDKLIVQLSKDLAGLQGTVLEMKEELLLLKTPSVEEGELTQKSSSNDLQVEVKTVRSELQDLKKFMLEMMNNLSSEDSGVPSRVVNSKKTDNVKKTFSEVVKSNKVAGGKVNGTPKVKWYRKNKVDSSKESIFQAAGKPTDFDRIHIAIKKTWKLKRCRNSFQVMKVLRSHMVSIGLSSKEIFAMSKIGNSVLELYVPMGERVKVVNQLIKHKVEIKASFKSNVAAFEPAKDYKGNMIRPICTETRDWKISKSA